MIRKNQIKGKIIDLLYSNHEVSNKISPDAVGQVSETIVSELNLGGKVPSIKITFVTSDVVTDRVNCIKVIRGLTGEGLKVAKEMFDNSFTAKQSALIDPLITSSKFTNLISNGRQCGMEITYEELVSSTQTFIKTSISELITYATLSGEYKLAQQLLSTMNTMFPRLNEWGIECKDEQG